MQDLTKQHQQTVRHIRDVAELEQSNWTRSFDIFKRCRQTKITEELQRENLKVAKEV